MNLSQLHSHRSATRAAHAVHETLGEIAAGVRELRTQSDAVSSEAAQESHGAAAPFADRSDQEVGSASETHGSTMAGAIPQAGPAAPLAPETRPAVAVAPLAPTSARAALSPVPDLGPELAKFTAALAQQHQATVVAFRQVTALCQRQQDLIMGLAREVSQLTSRLNRISRF